jgi:hypothetical protein
MPAIRSLTPRYHSRRFRDMTTLPGNISKVGEVDTYLVDLVGGVSYTIEVLGALPNPTVAVGIGGETTVVPVEPDPGQYTPLTSDTYVIGVSDLTGETGDYELEINPTELAASDFFIA